MALSRSLQVSARQSVQLRHFTFSRPDSAGRQHVESATLLSAVTGETHTEQAVEERKQTASLTEVHAGQVAEHTVTGSHVNHLPFWIAGVVAAGITIVFFMWKIIR
jgi:hypothetical protein